MRLKNSLTEYGFISKIFHWLSAAVLVFQIPLGFYLVDMDFSEKRLTIESIHVTLGLAIFYLTIFRLIYKNIWFNFAIIFWPGKILFCKDGVGLKALYISLNRVK